MKKIGITIFMYLCSFLGAKAQTPTQEVSYGSTRSYSIDVARVTAAAGIKEFHWGIVRKDGQPLEAGVVSSFPGVDNSDYHAVDITWDGTVGQVYVLSAALEDVHGCYSEGVTLEITIMPENAVLVFKDADDPANLIDVCSFIGADSYEDLIVSYTGAKPWDLHYKLVNTVGAEQTPAPIVGITNNEVTVEVLINNFFVNTSDVDENWKVVLLKAISQGDNKETLPGVVSERTIVVHPLPVIKGGITLN